MAQQQGTRRLSIEELRHQFLILKVVGFVFNRIDVKNGNLIYLSKPCLTSMISKKFLVEQNK